MNRRLAGRVAATALGLAAAGSTITPPALAGAPTTGCPNGYAVMSVAALAEQGYRVPGQVDDPTSGVSSFGSAGNGNGLVCAQEIGNRTTTWGGQLYQFWDDVLPA